MGEYFLALEEDLFHGRRCIERRDVVVFSVARLFDFLLERFQPRGDLKADPFRLGGESGDLPVEKLEGRRRLALVDLLHRRADQGAEAVDLERSDESLVQPIGHARQPHAVAADQLLVTLEVLPGDRFAPAEDRVAPQGGGLVEPFADQHVVDDHDGAQVPGDAIVAGQDAEEIEQRVEQFSVVRLGGGAVVIDVDRVVLDDRFDRQLEILDGLPPGDPPIQVGEQFEGRLLFVERVEELTGPLLQDRPQVAQVHELLGEQVGSVSFDESLEGLPAVVAPDGFEDRDANRPAVGQPAPQEHFGDFLEAVDQRFLASGLFFAGELPLAGR